MKSIYPPIAAGALLFVAAAISQTVTAADTERRQLDAHEHGVTILNIALEEGVLIAELEGPAMNFIGFEHPPRTPEQQQAVADTLDTLRGANQLLVASPAAECDLVEAEAEHITEASHDDHDKHHDEHHSDHDDGHDDHDGDHEADHDDGHDDEHGHHGDHDDEHEGESQHAEFIASYRFRCQQEDRLTQLSIGLFERFPLTNEIEASFVGPNVQTFKNLTPDNPVLQIK